MGTIFFTGFPGFLGVELLPRVLARSPGHRARCLVQAKFADVARRRVSEITLAHPEVAGRIELVEGDITVAGLGLDDPRAEAADVVEIWHLAAVYDLAVPRDVGLRINVDGTRHLLDFAEDAPSLERLDYVSTCYVSGRWAGPFAETDLDVGQSFNNFYEETKFLAEVEVAARRAAGLPTTVFRPAIVVGDSTTGATQKYDGPYFALQWMLRQKRTVIMPMPGDPSASRFNIVPRDYVVDAIAHLSGDPRSKDRTYQVADPHPLTVDELFDELARAAGRRLVKVPVPRRLAKWSIEKVPGVFALMRTPADTVDYLTHPTHYLTDNSADLDGSGISCPPTRSYIPAMVAYMQAHPDVPSTAMI